MQGRRSQTRCALSLQVPEHAGSAPHPIQPLLLPIQSRNSTVQCIFLAYFTPRMLPFPMPRSIPDKTHYIAWPDHHYSLSTAHYPLLSALCFHHFANPSSRLPAHIDFYFHYFHALTNCLFLKSFAFINICVAPWCFSREFVTFRYSHPKTSQVLYTHTITSSLSSPKKSSALESATSTLFSKNTRGMGTQDDS